jgi:predicted short-subunit dehydrogenase-like oxidoreductase (DUF2520 family)
VIRGRTFVVTKAREKAGELTNRLVSPRGNWNGSMSNSDSAPGALTVVGPGRAGGSIALAARTAGVDVSVAGREPSAGLIDGRCVLLCVPDAAIPDACATLAASEGTPDTVGHVSGATTLEPLQDAGAASGTFSVHTLQTIPDAQTSLAGAHAAVSGDSGETLALAEGLARKLGMQPFRVAQEDRAAYHAAASIASNFLVALEQSAADLLARIDVEDPREVLAPLVRRSLENWIEQGPAALTGPIARGDRVTVERHREALERSDPQLLPMYDVMAGLTARLGSAPGATR